jgi:hypothetical protein
MNRRTLITGATSASLLQPSIGWAARAIGRSVKAKGDSTLQRANKATSLVPDADLFEGDLVRTGAKSFAELMLKTATQINLGPNSEIGIDRFVADLGGVINIGGAIVFDRPENRDPIDLRVNSAFARMGVRGTRFFAGPSKGVYGIFVERGSLIVRTGTVLRKLGPGEGVDIAEEGKPAGKVAKWGAPRIEAAFATVGLKPSG